MWNYSNISAETTLTATVSPSDTAIPIGSTAGLPVSFPYTVVLDFEAAGAEVVTVTNLTGSTLTVTRGQDGTTAQSHNLGARVVHAVVARDLREPQEHIAASGDVHGVGGASNVVGTGTVQTLTNKTISGAANTITNIPAANLTGTATNFVTEASGTAAVPLTVKAVSGQVADRQRWEDHLGASPTRINAAGELVVDQVRTDGSMAIDGAVAVTGGLSATGNVSTSAEVIAERASEFDNCYRASQTGDSNARLLVRADGLHAWGPGNAAQDVNLYRSAADTLRTDDSLVIGGNLTVLGALGVQRLKAFRGGVFSVVHDTWTLMAWDNQVYASAGMHNTGVNPSRLIAPVTGKYSLFGQVQIQNLTGEAGGNDRSVNVRRNAAGSQVAGTEVLMVEVVANSTPTTPGALTTVAFCVDVDMTANDYLEVFWRHRNGGGDVLSGVTGAANTVVCMRRIIE